MSDLLPLLVVVPLVSSVLVLLAGIIRSETGWPITLVALALQIAGTVTVAREAFVDGPISYVVGGFSVPYGIELVVDGLSATMVVLIAVVAFGVLGFARGAGPRSNPFYAAYLLLVAGLTGISVTGDVFNMYVFLEIAGVAAYTLVASGERGESALAAFKYLLVGTVGASLFLLGIGFAYVATGTLNMGHLSTRLSEVGYTAPLVRAAFVLLVVGLFVKIALFPVHTWQPSAYAGAPDSVSVLISALVSTVAAYALLRVVFSVFTVGFLVANPLTRTILVAVAVTSIVAGSVIAVSQDEIKRMLAYSSVAQYGLVLGAIAIANETALTGAAIHLVGHAVMKGGLFLATGLIAGTTGARTIDEYDGLAGRLPTGSGGFSVLGFALVGVPPAVGFVGKWYIALGAVQARSWLLAVVILGSTLLTLAYIARLVERMYFTEPMKRPIDLARIETDRDANTGDEIPNEQRPALGARTTLVAAVVLSFVLGVAALAYGQLLEPTIVGLLS